MRVPYHELALAPTDGGCERDEHGRLRPRSDGVVLGRKFCCGCGRWRHVCDFSPLRRGKTRGRCRACMRTLARREYAAQSRERYLRQLEYQRIWHEAKRREAGIPERRCNRRTVVDRVEAVYLPREPLASMLQRRLSDVPWIAHIAGISERSILRLRTGESRHVRLDLADRLALALGYSLWELYGDQPLWRHTPGGGT
jgi:hypothetical protein